MMSYWNSKTDKHGAGKFLIYYGNKFVARFFLHYTSEETGFVLEFNSKLWVTVLVEEPEPFRTEHYTEHAYALLKGTERHWAHQIPTVVATKAKLKGHKVLIHDERQSIC